MNIESYKSNNNNIKLNLITTDDLNNVKSIQHSINKYFIDYINSGFFYRYLSDEYQPLTFSLYQLMLKSKHGTYVIDSRKIKKNETNGDKNIKLINDTIQIGNYVLVPVSTKYQYNVLSPLIFNYINILDYMPQNSTVCVINYIGHWEIKNKQLNLHFELEKLLQSSRNCIVKTIFIALDYGEEMIYDKIINNENNNNIDYIIIDGNNIINSQKQINDFLHDVENIFIYDLKLFSGYHCQFEVATLPFYIFMINTFLKSLKITGNLYLDLSNFKIYKPSIQFLYFITNMFDELQIIINNINVSRYGTYKFSGFKKNKALLDELNLLLNEYIKKDKYLGKNTIVKAKNFDDCAELEININKPNINFIIKSILSKIEPSFEQFIINSYKIKRKNYKIHLERIKYLKDLGDKIDINMIIANNIQKSIDFCIKHNIDVNPIYKDFIVINYNDVVKYYFNINKNINPKNIQLSIDSIYSITKPINSIRMCNILKKHFHSVNFIIDGNANIGAGAVVFAKFYNHIYAVEFIKETYDKLNNNIKVLGFNNKISTFNDDIIKFMNDKIKLDKINFNPLKYCLFLDPPWSGVFYKTEKNLDLFLGNTNILDFIRDTNIKYICIKVPFNYNFSNLYTYFYNVIIYRLSGFYFILINK
jgi:hypothetical protein